MPFKLRKSLFVSALSRMNSPGRDGRELMEIAMNRWVRRLLGSAVFAACFILGISQTHAVALGKIEVASHLGEAFFAEIPMQLEENENISSVFVDLAAPAEYRILEVYRDPALNAIRSDIKNDSRGARVEISSTSVIDAPFFNLVLKVRHGHATQFKKYPVFLELLQLKNVRAKTLPNISAVNSQTNTEENRQPKMPVMISHSAAESETEKPAEPAFKPYDGWARTGRYGPMVFGDTIRTVAIRLRMDKRYTLPQVMMALFNKNRKKFSQGNVNLINAGIWLDVPKASEVEEMTPVEASKLLARHQRDWNALKKGQPRYTAIAKAQKNRYKTRVRVGKIASGVVSPASATESREKTGVKTDSGQSAKARAPETEGATETVKPDSTQQAKLDALQKENVVLREDLKTADDKIDALSDKLASADIVAANVRIKKLELSLARLQAALDRSRQEAKSGSKVFQWLPYLLGGLVILLLAILGYLLRRERPHPAAVATSANISTPAPSPPTSQEDESYSFEERAQQVPAAEEEGIQVPVREAEDVSADSSPDLIKFDTAGIETPHEEAEETFDPNVDYMAEADIYLRYGMEDEAIDQIKMAIKQHPDHADAYITLIRTLQAKGDQAALNAAIEAGREALSGEALQALEAVASPADEGDEEIDLGSILPPADIGMVDSSETAEIEPEESGERGPHTPASDEVTGMMEVESADVEAEQAAESTLTETFELLDKTTASREEDEAETGESTTGEEKDKQDEIEGEAENFPELSIPEMVGFELDIPPVAGEEDEAAGHMSDGGDESSDIETSGTEHVDESGEIPDPGLESMQLDDLIMTPDTGMTPDSLHIDKARSLLAEGALDEAESSFRAAVTGSTRGDALLGLADIAQQRGDTAKAAEFLAEAEALVDDSNRDWFESIRNKAGNSE